MVPREGKKKKISALYEKRLLSQSPHENGARRWGGKEGDDAELSPWR